MPKRHATIEHELRIHFPNGNTHVIHGETQAQQISQLLAIRHKDTVEELLECLHIMLSVPYVMPHPEFFPPLNALLNSKEIQAHIHARPYSRIEPLPYDRDRGYGGLYIAYPDGSSTGYVVGSTEKVIPLCKNVNDTDEFSRLHKKWHSAEAHTILIASRDEPDAHRNFLIRGLQGSLNIIALVGVR